MVRDRPPDPPWMLLVCVRQCPKELARVRVELSEEGNVLLGFPTVVNVREAPAACAKANQLSSWLRITLGDHDDWFLSAVTVLATHLLTEALRLHVAFPGYRLLLLTPSSLFHDHS